MYRIALGIEYDGSAFHGWQLQKSIPSVQKSIEHAISQVADHSISSISAGRTDTGVHATEQVVHFDTTAFRSAYSWVAGCNTILGPELRILWAREVPSHFNARRSATSRHYRYVIYNHRVRPALFRRYISWEPRQLEVQNMLSASSCWLGEHDFSSFRAKECQSLSPMRRMEAIDVKRHGDYVILDFKANAFLHHMVRNMVGVLCEIGAGKMSISWADEVLKACSRKAGGVTASGEGLYLVKVQYPLEFGLPTQIRWPEFL